MTLKEELAERLFELGCKADPHPNVGSLEWSDEVGDAVADECLRQMEWQRFQQWNWRRDWDVGVAFNAREVPPPVTLAPEGWAP